ncbi:type II secretion system protein [Solibacillus sp. FSL R5-0691]|uniref:PulJ/GspJ family protein n=1 Tax=Solibacillus sp. FSL R5-0691 TaxID=2921653 RepID=UPI0030D52140
MKILVKNMRGITLVELLAVTAITSIVAILVFSLIQSSIKQQVQQTQETGDLNDITYALKVVTKDIRRSTSAKVKEGTLELTFPNASKSVYSSENGKLNKTTGDKIEIITDGIWCANFSGEDVISIKLSNTSVCPVEPSTEIHLRKGGS